MATQLNYDLSPGARPCPSGRHRPKRVPIGSGQGELRTTCRDCGCALVRTLATRQWFYSGPLV